MPRFIPLITALVTAPVLFAQQKELAEARGHLAQGHPFAAAAAARASLAVGETAEAWYFIGHGQLAADEADSARSSLERCLVLDPDHADAVFELGLALDERGEHEQAIGQFRRYAALAPMDERGPVQEAFVRLSGLNDAAGAERILDSLMTRFPSSAAVLYYQAIAEHQQGREAEAIAWLERGAQAHPDDADFPFQHGRWLADADRFTEAVPHLATAKELDPSGRRMRWWAWARMMAATDTAHWTRIDGGVRLTVPWIQDMKAMDAMLGPGGSHDPAELQRRFLAGEPMGVDEVFLFYYAQSLPDSYAPYADPAERELDALLEAGKFKEAITWADGHLREHPACLETWRSKAAACARAEDPGYAQATINYDLLLNAVLASGGGEAMEDAIWVMNIHDEYILIGYEGLRRGSQALLHEGGYAFDLLECTDGEDKPVKRYFNISKPFGSLSRMFGNSTGGGKKKKKK